MISAVVAVARQGVIGNHGSIPWYLPADLKHFRDLTLGHPVIMGRTTYESIVDRLGHGLAGRDNIVLTRDDEYIVTDATVVHTLDQAIDHATAAPPFIIGGAQIYELASSRIDTWFITEIDADIQGDIRLDKEALLADFDEVSREPHNADEKNPFDYSFVVYKRR
jgi:dihydrofolate reductase